jgi:hypothetical protein
MRRHAAPRTPGLGQLGQSLGIRALAQAERHARGFLNRQIARGKRIRVTKAEQEIDIGSPGADSMERGQGRVRIVGAHVANRGEIDLSPGHRLPNLPDGFDLGGRQTKALEFVGTRAPYCIMMKWVKCCEQPAADCGRAGRRKLLAADDGAEAGKARLAPAQTERACPLRNGLEPGIREDQLSKACLEIGVGLKEVGHRAS